MQLEAPVNSRAEPERGCVVLDPPSKLGFANAAAGRANVINRRNNTMDGDLISVSVVVILRFKNIE